MSGRLHAQARPRRSPARWLDNASDDCRILEQTHNVVLVGSPGTGKTHWATALGDQALEHHRRRVRFLPTIELLNALKLKAACGSHGQTGGALLFHLPAKGVRTRKASTT